MPVNVCNFESWRLNSVNFTNFAQFHKKINNKYFAVFLIFSLFTFHEAYNIKLFNASFILWKLLFAKIIIFLMFELNALRVGKRLRKRTLLTHKISYKIIYTRIRSKKKKIKHFFLIFQIAPQTACFSWDEDCACHGASTFLNSMEFTSCLILLCECSSHHLGGHCNSQTESWFLKSLSKINTMLLINFFSPGKSLVKVAGS